MKGSNSRQIAPKNTNFSNLFHIQGGMITDADLGEGAALAQARDEALGQLAVRTGVPAQGGAIAWQGAATRLRNGTVVADGKVGTLQLSAEALVAPTLFDQLRVDPDFLGPAPDAGDTFLLYADVWDRAVFAAQAGRMTDAGLHGTETSYRLTTMVQLKSVPWADEEPMDGDLDNFLGHPAMARTGNAQLSIGPLTPDTDTAGCDPCADRITVDRVLPNALWRLEVVGVDRKADGTVGGFALAWSIENASAIEPNTTAGRHAIKRGEGDAVVYEFFSDIAEKHKGWFAGGEQGPNLAHPSFETDIDGAVVESEGGDAYIRRWDGHLTFNGSDVQATGVSSASLSDGKIAINTGHFTATLLFNNKELLIGDFWHVEVRRFADPMDQLHLVGATTESNKTYALPCGPDHAFCPIGIIQNGVLQKPHQALAQITAFPTLTTLAAQDVAYDAPDNCIVLEPTDPDTGDKRQVHNVKDALNSLCDLDATRIKYEPDENCDTLADTQNVAEALAALCAADDDTDLRLLLRTMMDWGVVCGHQLTVEPGKDTLLKLSNGTALSPTGILQDHGDLNIDMTKIEVLGNINSQIELGRDLCVSMELRKDGAPKFYLSHYSFTKRSSDRNLTQRLRECLNDKTQLDSSDILQDVDEFEAVALSKVLTGATSRNGMGTTLSLNAEEFDRLNLLMDKLSDELLDEATGASRQQFEALKTDAEERFNATQEKARDEISVGVARLAFAVAKLTAMAVVERDMQSICVCEKGVVDCPTHSNFDRGLIPLGAVVVVKSGDGFAVRSLSNYTFRKQSHNWRSDKYYFGDRLTPKLAELGEKCGGTQGIDTIAEALLSWNPTPEELDEAKQSSYWPPDPGISNLEEIEGVFLRGFGFDKAREILKDASIEVVEDAIFSVEEEFVFERIAEVLKKSKTQPLDLNYQARSGDSVGMTIDREGRVADVFVVRAAPFKGYLKQSILPADIVNDNIQSILPGLVAEYLQADEGGENSTGAQLGGLIGDMEGLRLTLDARGTQLADLEGQIQDIRDNAPDLSNLPGIQAQLDALLNNQPNIPDIGPLETALGDLNTRVELLSETGTPQFDPSNLQEMIDGLSGRLGLLEANGTSAGPAFDDGPLQTEIGQLHARIDALPTSSGPAFDDGPLREQIGSLQNQVNALSGPNPEFDDGPLQAQIGDLQQQIDALPAPAPAFDDGPLQNQIMGLQTQINALPTSSGAAFDDGPLQEQIGDLQQQIDALPAPAPAFDDGPLQNQIMGLQTQINALPTSGGSFDDGPLRNQIGQLQNQVAQLLGANAVLRFQVLECKPVAAVLSPELLASLKDHPQIFTMGQLNDLKDDQFGELFGSSGQQIKDATAAHFGGEEKKK